MHEPKRISDRQIEALHAIAEAGHDIAAALRETHDTAALAKEATALHHKAREHESRMERLEGEIAGALTEAERERDAFQHDLTALREGLMERVGRYTPSDADLLAYVDALQAQIAAPVPAERPDATSGGVGTSGGVEHRETAKPKRIYLVFAVDVDNDVSDELDALGTVSEFSRSKAAWRYARWLMRNNPDDRVVVTIQRNRSHDDTTDTEGA